MRQGVAVGGPINGQWLASSGHIYEIVEFGRRERLGAPDEAPEAPSEPLRSYLYKFELIVNERPHGFWRYEAIPYDDALDMILSAYGGNK